MTDHLYVIMNAAETLYANKCSGNPGREIHTEKKNHFGSRRTSTNKNCVKKSLKGIKIRKAVSDEGITADLL